MAESGTALRKDRQIRLLPLQVANKIAAGEVVERPASVVKELVENAIDADATRIDINITAGGRKLIEIRDNGCGMSRDNSLLCIERQATSKIRDVGDIEQITTLGFRGEAIPSIASVSRMTIKTRREEDEAGTQLVIVGGTLQDVREIGTAPGTTIEVRDLFFNVPVRRKFLRAYQTEQAHIKSVFTLHSLAHPEIGMTLTVDGRELYNLPGGAKLVERAAGLFGRDFVADLKPIRYTAGRIQLSGFAALPSQARNDRSEQYIFINRRPATAPVIAYALREAYPKMEANRKPILLLFIEMPPEEVDVNVHPTKREVRFVHPGDVREAIICAIREAIGVVQRPYPEELPPAPTQPQNPSPSRVTPVPTSPQQGEQNPVPGSSSVPPVVAPPRTVDVPPSRPPQHAGDRTNPLAPRIATPQAPLIPSPCVQSNPLAPRPFVYPKPDPFATLVPSGEIPEAPSGSGIPLFASPAPDGAPWKWSRFVGQVADRFVLLETDSGIVTVDPQAARERVLYEQLLEQMKSGRQLSQKLLIPEAIQFPPADAARLRKHLDALRGIGFEIEEFGNDHFKVEALPNLLELERTPCRELLADIAQDFEQAGNRRGAEKWKEELIARAISHTAVRLAMKLRPEDAQKLVDQLAATSMPYTSPRGRPTMIFTSFRELDRKFR